MKRRRKKEIRKIGFNLSNLYSSNSIAKIGRKALDKMGRTKKVETPKYWVSAQETPSWVKESFKDTALKGVSILDLNALFMEGEQDSWGGLSAKGIFFAMLGRGVINTFKVKENSLIYLVRANLLTGMGIEPAVFMVAEGETEPFRPRLQKLPNGVGVLSFQINTDYGKKIALSTSPESLWDSDPKMQEIFAIQEDYNSYCNLLKQHSQVNESVVWFKMVSSQEGGNFYQLLSAVASLTQDLKTPSGEEFWLPRPERNYERNNTNTSTSSIYEEIMNAVTTEEKLEPIEV